MSARPQASTLPQGIDAEGEQAHVGEAAEAEAGDLAGAGEMAFVVDRGEGEVVGALQEGREALACVFDRGRHLVEVHHHAPPVVDDAL